MKINSIVLSAGKGTRMKSDKPKVIQPVLGYEMVNHVLKSLTAAGVENNLLVVGYKREEVLARIDSRFSVNYAVQEQQLGTGHAVLITKDILGSEDGITLITSGDTPLIESSTFKDLVQHLQINNSDLVVLTTTYDNPNGYGRIIRGEDGLVSRIVEQKDANEDELAVNEVNTGVYAFNNKKLFKYIENIDCNNAQSEYYLTDLISLFKNGGERVDAFCIEDNQQVVGVNDLVALSEVNDILRNRINQELMLSGVQIINSATTNIGPNVKIGQGTIIYPGNTILGNSEIGENTTLLPNNTIEDSTVGSNCNIGPMSYLRNNVKIGDNCRIGNFVEFKNTIFGNSSKCAHLTYIGDATVGSNCNIGCGVITANYDGENKFRTEIGDDAFIGSNVNLIAPVHIGNKVFIAAGTTVTNDIEDDKFAIDRQPVRIKNRKKN